MKLPRLGFTLGAAVIAAAFTIAAAPAPVPDAAKKEGVVVWYATMNTKDMDATANQFMRTHPGIRVESLRLGSSQLPARVATEQRGGKFNADVISGDEFQISQLLIAGAFDKYQAPDQSKFEKGTYDANGYWTNLYQNTTVIAWNPDRLKADHLSAPRTFADFAKPEWKGKFAIDTGALNWYLGVLQVDKNGADLVKRIAANSPQKTAGHTQTAEQLGTGEFDASPTVYGYMASQQKKGGRKIDYAETTPVLVSLNPIGLAKNAPHPNAAKVFLDWLLSKEGQTFIAWSGGGEISSRTDVHSNPEIWNPKRPYAIVRAPNSQQYNDAEHAFRALFGLPG